MRCSRAFHAHKCLVFSLLVALVACTHSTENVSELTNSDGVKAIWLKRNYGATTPFVYSLYIVDGKAPTDLKEGEELLRTDDFEGVLTKWTTSTSLSVSCLRGNIYKFENVFYINGNLGRIELQTACGASGEIGSGGE